MVDLAKIRKKAKEKKSGAQPPPPPTPDEKLRKFLAQAGTPRFAEEPVVPEPADGMELLTFILGSGRYAIDLEDVVEITEAHRTTRVPNTAPGTVGIFALRGSIVTLLDLRARLEQPPGSGEDSRIVVIRDGASLAGFEVDRVVRPARVERARIEHQSVVGSTEQRDCVRGVVRSGDALTIVLDLAKLLN